MLQQFPHTPQVSPQLIGLLQPSRYKTVSSGPRPKHATHPLCGNLASEQHCILPKRCHGYDVGFGFLNLIMGTRGSAFRSPSQALNSLRAKQQPELRFAVNWHTFDSSSKQHRPNAHQHRLARTKYNNRSNHETVFVADSVSWGLGQKAEDGLKQYYFAWVVTMACCMQH